MVKKLHIKESNTPEEDKVVKSILKALDDYVTEFNRSVKGIGCRYATDPDSYYALYMDYFALRPTYTKTDVKKALDIFKKYTTIITSYLDVLKMEYPDLEYYVDKTEMSGSKIGKELFVPDFPYELPRKYNEYDERGQHVCR